MKLNKSLIASDIMAGLTMLAAIPYDKDTMQLVNHILPDNWIPWIIKLGIAATLALRLVGRWTTTQPVETKP